MPFGPMAGACLENLNPQQRRAVEHGGSVLAEAGPLLIIAGAGSGKTSTLARRVAHLIERGADPRRIMLLTFSRRASVEMTRRVGRIVAGIAQGKRRCNRGWHDVGRDDMGRHVPRDRGAAVTRICRNDRACARFHDP
ncbi:MAG TPA: UvrD-helicase domain-containing protein [Stellaceae bacterium]|nr:UvrD-helicase domain-containing protein [Stellaceae bacterium]